MNFSLRKTSWLNLPFSFTRKELAVFLASLQPIFRILQVRAKDLKCLFIGPTIRPLLIQKRFDNYKYV